MALEDYDGGTWTCDKCGDTVSFSGPATKALAISNHMYYSHERPSRMSDRIFIDSAFYDDAPFRGISRPGHLTFRIALDHVCFHHRKFEFKEPIELCFLQDDGVWTCEACGIVSVGSDPQEAAMSFCEDFSVCWDQIAQKSDESLSEDAQETKKCMLSIVKSVE